MLFDRLTRALKKEVFEYLLEKELARAIRYPFTFSLALIELDPANGNGKNPEAQKMQAELKALGNLLRMELRNSDILGREQDGIFCWLMPETDEQGAQVAGERIQKVVEGFKFNGKPRTVSMGMVTFPTQSLALSQMLQKARDRLARAKTQGGNQICISEEVSSLSGEP